MTLKLPPFGKSCRGAHEIRVYFGNADTWDMAKWTNEAIPGAGAVVLPRGDNPDVYRWPVRGLPVVAVQRGAIPAGLDRHLALTLLEDGAQSVMVCTLSHRGRGEVRRYER